MKGDCLELVLNKLSELTGIGPFTLILMITVPVVLIAMLAAARYKRRDRRNGHRVPSRPPGRKRDE